MNKSSCALSGSLVILFCVLLTISSYAQPKLSFRDIVVNWPTVKLLFSVKCQNNWVTNFQKQNFKVFEDSIEVGEFEVWCPPIQKKCPIIASLVLDASGSMKGAKNLSTIAAANEFVSNMDGQSDKAAVLWFNNRDTLVQSMTSDKVLLKTAIDSLPAAGTTAVWDATYSGIAELVKNSSQADSCRAVVVLTDGMDNSSWRQLDQVIAYAQANKVRVFTIGVGDEANGPALAYLASKTGGKYFHVATPDLLKDIYQEIFMEIAGIDRCEITYQSKCPDGSLRTVELKLINFCGGSDAKVRTYTAPLLNFQHIEVELRIGKHIAKEKSGIIVPVELVTLLDKEYLNPFATTIRYDTSCVEFDTLVALDKCVLQNAGLSVTRFTDGIILKSSRKILIDGNGVLAHLRFRTKQMDKTKCCPITIAGWSFAQGCLRILPAGGEICVIANEPYVTCALEGPERVVWDRNIKDYSPKPIRATMRVSNLGEKSAINARYTILYNPNDFILISPLSDVQRGFFLDLPVGVSDSVSWELRAKHRIQGDSAQICIKASFYNYQDVICCLVIRIPRAEPALQCDLILPQIKTDTASIKYLPMPFEVKVDVKNIGGRSADSVYAVIQIPPGLRFSNPDSDSTTRKLTTPYVLQPGQSGTAVWKLFHPITNSPKNHRIIVSVFSVNSDSAVCEDILTIPALDAPVLDLICSLPDSLIANKATEEYTPNPFDVTVQVVNRGNKSLFGVTALIHLPSGVELAPSTDSLKKTFNPSTLIPLSLGGASPELTWRIRFTKKVTSPLLLPFKWTVSGVHGNGKETEPVETTCPVLLKAFDPHFACKLILPDSIGANPDRLGYTPNPFSVVYKIWNFGSKQKQLSAVQLNLPSDGVRLDGSTPKERFLNIQLQPGDTLEFSWLIHCDNRISPRDLLISVSGIDDQGNITSCEDHLRIVGLSTRLSCRMTSSEDTIRYDHAGGIYVPTTWTISAALSNTGREPVSNVEATIHWTSPEGIDLVELDPGIPGNTSTKSNPMCFPGQSRVLEWIFRLKNQNSSGKILFPTFTVVYKADGEPEVKDGCERTVAVEPPIMKMPSLLCELMGPDTIRFINQDYSPSPARIRLRIVNTGTVRADNLRAFLLQNSSFTIIPPAVLMLGSLGEGQEINFDVNDGFSLRINYSPDQRKDTIRVAVVADGFEVIHCEIPVFIERERSPVFAMSCIAEPDSISFDVRSQRYVPDPFNISVRTVNTGDAIANDCEIVSIGAPNFTLHDSISIVSVGNIEIGGSSFTNWKVKPLCRKIGGWDTLVFKVTGRGGYGNRLNTAECKAQVFVPPCNAPDFKIICSIPDPLTWNAAGDGYLPDPFVFKVTIANTGLVKGELLTVTPILPNGVSLNIGETLSKTVIELPPSGSVEFVWLLRATAQVDSTVLPICALLTDREGKTRQCCANILIPGLPGAALSAQCTAPDSLHVDISGSAYIPNPFESCVTVTNTGRRAMDSVRISVRISSGRINIIGSSEMLASSRLLSDSVTAPACLNLQAIPASWDERVYIFYTVTAAGCEPSMCTTSVFIPAIESPTLRCAVSTNSQDTLRFDIPAGDYEGVPSVTGRYSVIRVISRIENIGSVPAKNVQATILPPEGFILDVGETAIREAFPADLDPRDTTSVSWNLKPIRQDRDSLRIFRVITSAENSLPTYCATDLFVKGAPKVSLLSIPDNLIGRTGEKVSIPIMIDPSYGKDIYAYRLNIAYNHKHLTFLNPTASKTLTEYGWRGPVSEAIPVIGSNDLYVLRVHDFTTGTPLNQKREGALVNLIFEVAFGYGYEQLRTAVVGFPFVDSIVSSEGMTFVSSLNSMNDSTRGDVIATFQDGRITLSGECIIPLQETKDSEILFNRPNPFNTSTLIEYNLAEPSHVRITVSDILGRHNRTLVDQQQNAGRYAVPFDAELLPGGVYFCRIETMRLSRIVKLIYLK